MPLLSLLLDFSTRIESSFGHISSWVTNWAMELMFIDIPLVSAALSPPIFTLIGDADLYSKSVSTNLVLSSLGGISARSSRKKRLQFFIRLIMRVQCCVWGSASNFQVLPRYSGCARVFGSICPFFGWPRSYIVLFFESIAVVQPVHTQLAA